MNNIYLALGLLLIPFGTLQAQYPANRTPKTIVADVLAQMPARDAEQFQTQMGDLASAGEESVLLLTAMMNPPDEGNNSRVEYALSGLSHYVTQEGREADRIAVSGAYVKALDMTGERETKAFIIRQLEIAGGPEAVVKLSSYLNDERLSGPSSRALASIGKSSVEARDALLTGLGQVTQDESRKNIVNAVAELGLSDAEPKLLEMLRSNPDRELESVLLYALGRCGGRASLEYLSAAITSGAEKNQSADSYITIVRRMAGQGYIKDAQKAAKSLDKAATNADCLHVHEAAAELQMAAKPAGALKMVREALKDDDRDYRCAVLGFASDYADERFYRGLVKTYGKAPADTRIDIMNWLAQECADSDKQRFIAAFGIAPFGNDLSGSDFALKSSAAALVSRIGGGVAVESLANMLESNDAQTVALAEKLLNTVAGDISQSVAAIIPSASDAGKAAALRLLGNRRSSAYFAVAAEQANNGSPEVKAVAFSTLKNVATAENLPALYIMLETGDPKTIAPLQQAIASVIKGMPSGEQLGLVTSRMQQASRQQQYLYYPILTATGDPESLKIVTAKFSEESGAAKDAAFQALVDWKGEEAAGLLLNVCKDPSASVYFDRALERYIRLASDPSLAGEKRRTMLSNALEVAKTDEHKNIILRNLGRTNSRQAMLLAGEYLNRPALQQAAAGAVMNIALNNKRFTGDEVKVLLEKVIEVLDNPDADYQKEAIRKHLAESPKPFELSAQEKKEGFRILFDGTDMRNWTGNTVDYIIEDGCISLDPKGRHGGNLYTKEEFSNFVYRFDFQLTPAANNGVGIRTPMGTDAAYHGMEIQILDHDNPAYRNITPLQVHGSVYGIIGAERGHLKPVGEWNEEEIMADGDHIKVTLNGVVILDGNIRDATAHGTADGHEHPGLFNKKGHIGFLGHGSPVKFRNIRIRELK